MSEPSILDYASMRDLDQVMESVGQKVQTMVSLATELATSLSHQRAERAREAAASSEAERRQRKERQDALYEADRLVWRRTWDDRFWENATPDRIARAWEACAPWAMQGFPSAQATIEHMRSEISDRFGLDVDPVQVHGTDLATLLGVDPEERTDTPTTGPEAALEAGRLQSINYRIRGLQNDGEVADTGVIHLASDDGAGVARQIAAELLVDHQRLHGRGEHGFLIEVFSGDQPGTGTLLHSMDAGAAEEIRNRYDAIVSQGREADARAKDTGAGSQEVVDALRLQRRRIRERLTSLTNPDDAVEADPQDLAVRQIWIRDELARVGTRLQAAEADMRGEDGDVVLRWASLRYELDEQWWQSATGDEAAAVWEQVADWPEGQARDRALDHLRAAFHREYEVELPQEATVKQVREELSVKARRTGPDREALSDDAEELRRRSGAEESEAQRARDVGDRMQREASDPAAAQAEHTWAGALLAAAEQDEAAAAVYEAMAHSADPLVVEGAEAATTSAQGFPAGPSARQNRSARQAQRGGPSGDGGQGRPVQRASRHTDAPSR